MRETPAAVPASVNGRPALAGGSPEADGGHQHLEVAFVALAFAAATIFFGIVPQPLFDLANHAAASLTGLL
jgi:NADH:ubiquinone oxidoreductase subunit 2 (subunit N)